MTTKSLICDAKKNAIRTKYSKNVIAGAVSAALETDTGRVYTGISIEAPCGMGFCAEHSAIAEMLKNGESKIKRIVAIDSQSGRIVSPCGRCRELMRQINEQNLDYTEVIITEAKILKLKELLTFPFIV